MLFPHQVTLIRLMRFLKLHDRITTREVNMLRLLSLVVILSLANGLTAAPPNIIMILTDDQGYGDFSCHGNPILKTPNLDKLHDTSVRFTDFTVSPTCSPTRSSFLSGKHEFKNGITHTILERERMSLKTYTLAQCLKANGYTTGVFGKWHLGDEDEYQPGKRGFDEVFIHGAGGIGQSYPGSCGDAPGNTYFNPAIRHNGKFELTNGYCTDVFFNQASKWIDQTRNTKPFFAYIATNAPHGPLQVRPEDEARYTGKAPENPAKFFGMIANIDDNVGKLLTKLSEWKLERDTIVIFMTDNGGTAGTKIFNAGMRAQKGTPYRGGTRGACFIRWPGTLTPGDRTQIAAHIDLYPTLVSLTGSKLPEEVRAGFDGRDLTPDLKDASATWDDRTLFTHVGRWPVGKVKDAKFANCAVRFQNFNMVSAPGKKATANRWELFDLKTDPGESKNIAEAQPAIVAKLTKKYDAWWDEVQPSLVNENATGPEVNPFKLAYWQQFPKK